MTQQYRGTTHQERIRIARRLKKKILERHKDAVKAVFIYGSTAKGMDRPYSDLELKVIVEDGAEIPEKYYMYKDLIIDIGYAEESKFLAGARRVSSSWPLEADQYRNYIALFERRQWTRRLRNAVKENAKTDTTEAARYAMMELTESLHVLRNAHLENDRRIIRARGRGVASSAANLVLLLNREYIITTSKFWKHAFGCPIQPPNFRKLVDTAAGFTSKPPPPERIVESCEQMYKEVLAMVNSRGISIESSKLIV